jgi:hypothetical protein
LGEFWQQPLLFPHLGWQHSLFSQPALHNITEAINNADTTLAANLTGDFTVVLFIMIYC